MLNGYAANKNRIEHISSAIDELLLSNKILKEDVDRIENLLVKLIEKPIIINNTYYDNLETKIINLIDILIKNIGDNSEIENNLQKVKSDIFNFNNNINSRNRLIRFFKEIGNDKSDINKTIKGAGIIPNPNYKILFMLHIFGINFNQKAICISLYISLFD